VPRQLLSSDSREVCLRCRRPLAVCYCAHLVPLPTSTRVVILQHPREARMPIGTARMAHLMLPNSEILAPEGPQVTFADHSRVRELTAGPLADDSVALLYPGPGAHDPAQLPAGTIKTLVVIDGTWAQARKLYNQTPSLHRLIRIGLTPTEPGNYRIRREPAADCLATIEALAHALGVLERSPERFREMLGAFTYMVDRQIALAAARTEPPRRWKSRARQAEVDAQYAEQLARAVVVHAEVNAQPRESRERGRAELLHLVARRLGTGESFAAVVAPRRPLGANSAFHLGLAESRLLVGETLAAVQARWAAFLQPADVLCGWGHFTRDQLAAEGIASGEWLDLRLLVARRTQASPGAPAQAAQTLLAPPLPPFAEGRAGATVTTLARIVGALQN
jgi:DTW domain-containing protein YfiP